MVDIAFSRDEKLVEAAGADGKARVYTCSVCRSTPGLLALARSRVGSFTADERVRFLHDKPGRG